MSEEEKLQLENECLLKYSKSQMIQKYIDELEENCTLSDLWCKSQEENKELKNKIEVYKDANECHQNIIKEVREWLNKTIFYFDFEKEVTSHTFELLYTAQGQELLNILDKGE